MIVPVEKIQPKKKTIGGKLAKCLRRAFLVRKDCYPIGQIERELIVNAENVRKPGAITQASVNSVLRAPKLETQEEPPSFLGDEPTKYATIRRSYSVRYKYSVNRFNY